jgi:probable H4MPT-linked C1 transfer pathway protein
VDGEAADQVDDADQLHRCILSCGTGMSEGGVIGWDVGGVNTKVARVRGGTVIAVHGRPYEVQRDPGALTALLRELAASVGGTSSDRHALTMTAELSQMFRTKREGVAFVLDAIEAAFPTSDVCVFTTVGRFVSIAGARAEPQAVAAANWTATARMVATLYPDAILIDVGTTSTDIIPVVGGRVMAKGLTDPARLASGELVYTGALRTPVEAIVSHVPLYGGLATVSAEGFALVGDVHLWRGDLAADDYSVTAPDGRAASREFAGERIARVVCADRELLDDAGVSVIADAVADEQRRRVVAAIRRVLDRHPRIRTAVVTGLGAFIARGAAEAAGMDVIDLARSLGSAAARCAPAAAVALLLDTEAT